MVEHQDRTRGFLVRPGISGVDAALDRGGEHTAYGLPVCVKPRCTVEAEASSLHSGTVPGTMEQ